MKKLLFITLLFGFLGTPKLLPANTKNFTIEKQFRRIFNGSGVLYSVPWGNYYTVGITYDGSSHAVLGVQVYYGSSTLTIHTWNYSSASLSGTDLSVTGLYIEFTDQGSSTAYIDYTQPGQIAHFTVS